VRSRGFGDRCVLSHVQNKRDGDSYGWSFIILRSIWKRTLIFIENCSNVTVQYERDSRDVVDSFVLYNFKPILRLRRADIGKFEFVERSTTRIRRLVIFALRVLVIFAGWLVRVVPCLVIDNVRRGNEFIYDDIHY